MKEWDKLTNEVRTTKSFLTKSVLTNGVRTTNEVRTKSKLISINKLEIGNDMAYACYTTHSQFNNDDIVVLTSIFQKINGIWKFVFGQFSDGRKTEDKLPLF